MLKNSKAKTLVDRVVKILSQNPGHRYTTLQIAKEINEQYPDVVVAKKEKSKRSFDDAALIQQISSEIGGQRLSIQIKNPGVKTTERRPRQYYYSESSDDAGADQTERELEGESAPGSASVKEREEREKPLYDVLGKFVLLELKVHSKRIDEKKKRPGKHSGSGVNKWLFPDLVGLEDLSAGWDSEIKEHVYENHFSDRNAKLWSFEVKDRIDKGNLRLYFFQAVSNSSWANFSYLAAGEISGDDETLKGLQTLSSLHGIGLIDLNAENPTESQIIIPAKETEVDWNAASRLTEVSQDFLNYVQLVRKFYRSREVNPKDWDYKSQ